MHAMCRQQLSSNPQPPLHTRQKLGESSFVLLEIYAIMDGW